MTQEIFSLAKSLGAVGPEQESALLALCEGAQSELAGELRAGVAPEDCRERFLRAAAWLALADLRVGEASSGVESFTAGGLTIRQRSGEKDGEALRKRAWELMAPYLSNRGFCFQGVKG